MAWLRNRQAIILTPSVAQRFRLFGIAFVPSIVACSSSMVMIMAVIAVPICSVLYSCSKEVSSPKFVRYDT